MTRKSPKSVNVNRLRSGDILLSRPRGIESWFIAKLGGSRFSHAEIVVNEPEGGLCVYEATTDHTSQKEVVGLVRKKLLVDYQYAPRFPSRAASADEKRKFFDRPSEEREPVLAKDISEYVEFEVLRRPGPVAPEFRKFQNALAAICSPLHLEPYAGIDAISRLTAFPWLVNVLAKRTGLIPDHIVPGLFCSQLVAMVYKEGGFALSSLPPEDVTPRHLAEFARMPNGPLVVVPPQTLLFSPGSEYVLANDWRATNAAVNRHSADTAFPIRIWETIERDLKRMIHWKPKFWNWPPD
jgi:hypothetical protein